MAMNLENSLTVVIRLRVAQLFYHYCHNLTHGPMFLSYHDLFESFYKEVESHYDKIIEYTIADLGISAIDTQVINKAIQAQLEKYKVEEMTAQEMIERSLEIENDLYKDLEELADNSRLGLENALGTIAEASDVRSYKLKQLLRSNE